MRSASRVPTRRRASALGQGRRSPAGWFCSRSISS